MKLKLLSILLLVSPCAAQSVSDYREFIKSSEGYKNIPYIDNKGYSVGIGHYSPTKFSKQYYTDGEINKFFAADLSHALTTAKNTFPSFNTQPREVKLILTSLCFNLGPAGINKFTKFKAAIHNKDYAVASMELRNSLWFRQVGNRGIKYTSILSNL